MAPPELGTASEMGKGHEVPTTSPTTRRPAPQRRRWALLSSSPVVATLLRWTESAVGRLSDGTPARRCEALMELIPQAGPSRFRRGDPRLEAVLVASGIGMLP